MRHSKKPLVVALTAAFALTGGSAFAAADLASGYMVASIGDKAAEAKCGADKKAGEHKCGEAKCGADKKAAADGKTAEHKCGADKKTGEHKCGEAKCGAEKKPK